MRQIILLSILISSMLIPVNGQDLMSELDSAILNSFDQDGPGVTVLIKHKGELIYHKGFGMANVEQNIKMDARHVFRIGSITKQFTACAILKLAEEEKLSLTDNLQKYLPDYPTQGQVITIEHLLTHTSGIKSYTGLQEWTPELQRKDFTPLELIEYFKRDSLDFMPGERFMYNNSGYFILGYIIENVSGLSYEDYIESMFFKPLGMDDSRYDHPEEIISMRVAGYNRDDSNLQNANYLSMTQPYSAGSLMSTVSDLSKWYEAVFSYKVIKEESLKMAHTAYELNNGKSTGYGYGWIIGNRLDRRTIEHGGGINGSLTKDLYFPEDDLFIVVFSNCTCFPPDPLALKLGAIVLDVDTSRKEISLSNKQLKRLLGEYELMEGFVLTVTLKDNQLMIQATGQGISPVFPESEFKFFSKLVDAQIEFVMEGEVASSLILYQGGASLEGKKIN
ncbi:MAG: serine hydrolase [Bacteroidales bacterium]|nr:serine hydrolase [Bacteroidales bacterium]